ncbi:Replication-associated protein G2P [Shewanella sp. 4t3-1-2LB]|uniref:phage/plasmid replication domain-containing protein n=1 Tax=Shewanella sp. 4t3-1-2LB TaxID=2817682 RepID=UPI001A9891F0|nr:phage/plasmid replication protein [Shewanella sp. 4t3-1-2LB]MBO1271192.1 Replication-associated protein G2P [Shewanella sp. 4t3-1-2LB]
MFFDWLTVEQDFGFQLPFLADVAYQRIFVDTGEGSQLNQAPYVHKGSFCDTLIIKIRGSLLRISGNPSRWNRLDNLFGLPSVDACMSVYNGVCRQLGLPEFTRGTFLKPSQIGNTFISDGAVIKELHITENISVGAGNVDAYLSGLSTQRYRNSVPRLHTDGKTVDWLSVRGNANLIYPSVYDKAYEMWLHQLPKLKNTFSNDSPEVEYLNRLIDYCNSVGIVRFEQKLKSRYLQKNNLCYWGMSDFSKLNTLHSEFLHLDRKLQVTAMDFETISELLLSAGVVDTTRAANTTAMYALQWMHGQSFNLSRRSIQTHRARLRKVGIDIAQPCNISRFSPVFVTAAREVTPAAVSVPSWYQMPRYLAAV